LYNLAAALSGEAKYADAIAEYRHMLTIDPGNARALNGLGAALNDSGDWQAAEKTFSDAVTTHPDSCDARFDLANLELKHDQASDAERQFRAMLAQCPSDAGMHSGLGVALGGQGNTQAAADEFEKALALDAHDFTALYNLGDLALQAGQFSQAVEMLKTAVQQRPRDADAHEHLADAYAQSGRLGDAAIQLREAIRISPDTPALHALLSQVLDSTGDLQAAIAEQRTALRLAANDADGWNNLGVLEARAGRNTQARADFLHALQIAPDHAQARANLGRLPPS
jgi:Flp pilus assembly protein TadD